MNSFELKELLEEKYQKYNNPTFIETDPVSIPHIFSQKENIEISGFLTATIAWGQRSTIISNAKKLMVWMGNNPIDYLLNSSSKDWEKLRDFCHRTFQGADLVYFIKTLAFIFKEHGGLGKVFSDFYAQNGDIKNTLEAFYKLFFSQEPLARTRKHLADVSRGSSAKRLNMFLRWMIRNDGAGVDFGLWPEIPPSALYLPLDVHTGNVARMLGLLRRKQNDWKAVEEVTENLRQFDANDPVKYDFALFGLGIFEGIK